MVEPEQRPQSQASLKEQLALVYFLANKHGYYDAADFIRNALERQQRE